MGGQHVCGEAARICGDEDKDEGSNTYFASVPGIEWACRREVLRRLPKGTRVTVPKQGRLRIVLPERGTESADPRACRCIDKLYWEVGRVRVTPGQTLSKAALQIHLESLPWEESSEAFLRLYYPDISGAVPGGIAVQGGPRRPRLSFRVTANRDKEALIGFTSTEVERATGAIVHERLGWPVALKDFRCRVYVRIDVTEISVGFEVPLGRATDRGVQNHSAMSLRQSIAFLLVELADIQKSHVVLDPMCGGASVLLQAMEGVEAPCMSLGGDVYPAILPKAQLNLSPHAPEAPEASEAGKADSGLSPRTERFRAQASSETVERSVTGAWDLVNMDVTRLPLKTGSVDRIITDMPFGKRSGESNSELAALYPKALNEMARVLRPGTGKAIIMTANARLIHRSLPPAAVSPGEGMAAEFWTISEPVTPVIGERDSEPRPTFHHVVRHGPDWVHVFELPRSPEPFRFSRRRGREAHGARCFRCGQLGHSDVRTCPNPRVSDQEFSAAGIFRPYRRRDAAAAHHSDAQ